MHGYDAAANLVATVLVIFCTSCWSWYPERDACTTLSSREGEACLRAHQEVCYINCAARLSFMQRALLAAHHWCLNQQLHHILKKQRATE